MRKTIFPALFLLLSLSTFAQRNYNQELFDLLRANKWKEAANFRTENKDLIVELDYLDLYRDYQKAKSHNNTDSVVICLQRMSTEYESSIGWDKFNYFNELVVIHAANNDYNNVVVVCDDLLDFLNRNSGRLDANFLYNQTNAVYALRQYFSEIQALKMQPQSDTELHKRNSHQWKLLYLLFADQYDNAKDFWEQQKDSLPNDEALPVFYNYKMALYDNRADSASYYLYRLIREYDYFIGNNQVLYYNKLLNLYYENQRFNDGMVLYDEILAYLKEKYSTVVDNDEAYLRQIKDIEQQKKAFLELKETEPRKDIVWQVNALKANEFNQREVENNLISDIIYRIPTAGNSWIYNSDNFIWTDMVDDDGIRHWRNKDMSIRTFFYCEKAGKISLGIRGKVEMNWSKLFVKIDNQSTFVKLSNRQMNDIWVGDFDIDEAGYHCVEISGLKKRSRVYADINDILIKPLDANKISYINDDFVFGRRGATPNLFYIVPERCPQNIEWFYSEAMVPDSQDVAGCYYAIEGFDGGYFGIQVNHLSKKQFIFSIWSPYVTDNPSEIPEEYRVTCLRKRDSVLVRDFGDEGSGLQSFKIFEWKTNIKYGFLVGARPNRDNTTDFVAYFYDPESTQWYLMAEFKQPKTNTYLQGLYSFSENFLYYQGIHSRKAYYGNQWVCANGQWYEIRRARFEADNTAQKGNRMDYSGGIEHNMFYLKNGGFTNDHTPLDSYFTRELTDDEPDVDFEMLP